MSEQEPKCDYCGEKAVKIAHSYADNVTLIGHYYCEKHDKEHTLSGELIRHRISSKIQCRLFFVCNLILVAVGVG